MLGPYLRTKKFFRSADGAAAAAPAETGPDSASGEGLDRRDVGFSGEIRALAGPSLLTERLRELGFLSGEIVRVVGRAPFGEPLLVEVRGATVALRRAEAACLKV